MRRRDFIGGLLSMTLGCSVDLGACGDKFLRLGRSARFPRYAAVHRARIVICRPVHSTRAGIDELKALLKRAGHKPVVLERTASLSAALAASPYDVVMADYQDAGRLKADLQSAASHPVLLPILSDQSTAVQSEAMRQYAYLIRLPAMTKYDALAEIDRLMEARNRAVGSR